MPLHGNERPLSLRTHLLLAQAFARGFHMDPNNPPAPPSPEPKKIELTQEELDKRTSDAVTAALKKHQDDAAEKERKQKEERERKEAEEQGKHKELAEAAEKKRIEAEEKATAAELKARTLEVKDKLRDVLAKDHPDYVGVAGYIMPLITFDLKTDDAAVDKSIKAAVEQFVKDNPRKVTSGPPPAPRGNLPPGRGGPPRVSPTRSIASSRF